MPMLVKFDLRREHGGRSQWTVFPSQVVADEEDGVARLSSSAGMGWRGASLDQTLAKAPLKHWSQLATQAVMRSGVGRVGSRQVEGRLAKVGCTTAVLWPQ